MMSAPAGDLRPSLDEIAEEAQRALEERPSLSIRRRISLGFFLLFALALGITIAAIIILSRIQTKLLFMEAAGNYSFEIQQARRFEKNYFLYGTNLADALDHALQARDILNREGEKISSVVGAAHFQIMVSHIQRYEELLNQLAQLGRNRTANAPPKYEAIEEELRQHGAEMVSVAEELMAKERKSINTMLLMSQRVPIVFLLALLVLVIYLTNFVARQMLSPLNRLMEATRRISEGDFTPITPRRHYRDEFSQLAMALNHMMRQVHQRQEQLLQAHKLKAIGTLTAGVAHELNNPLNNIMLTSSALMEEYKQLSNEEREDMINDLLHESERAQKIVRKLLDFAREGEMESEAFEIGEVIARTIQLAGNQIDLANVKVRGESDSSVPQVYGDKQQISRVFLNIILNALDAMPKGGTLTISVRNTKDREYVAIDFTDTGVGIPEHKLTEIFDPFYTTKKNGKGTGLGLSVSLGIVQQHGGEIKVASKVNEGSTFTVLLSAAKIPANMPESKLGGKECGQI